MKRILVTGGAGFIGQHLCKALLDRGNEVICVDNLSTGKKENIKELLKNPNFEFIRHDITFPLYVEVDQIYNLACPASPKWYQKDPVQTIKTCVHGAINMLGLAKRVGARILQASTSEVYGDPAQVPQSESYWGNVNSLGMRSCYDEGKRCAESLFINYHRQHGVDVRIARIFNTYGPGMDEDDGRVVSNFIVQMLKGDPITIYGDGSQTRCFCYISDMVIGLINYMNCEDAPITMNIGSTNEFSVKELAELILKQGHNISSEVVYKKLPIDDPKRRVPNVELAEKHISWNPTVSIKQGLEQTISYFNRLINE
jgi:UDP-glucuronate decarboxylase